MIEIFYKNLKKLLKKVAISSIMTILYLVFGINVAQCTKDIKLSAEFCKKSTKTLCCVFFTYFLTANKEGLILTLLHLKKKAKLSSI